MDTRWWKLTAGSGELAIGIANAERPDLILLDIAIPGIGGVEALRRLKADPATVDISVVVLCAQAETELVKYCVELGASDYLGKAYRYGWLLSTMKDVPESSSHEHAMTDSRRSFFVNLPTKL